ncbi:MAG: YbaN family protein [Nitrospiraceae bacterium]|nr:MAG: YbaN family protein [Nitrospiraceae bacterium]UCH45607.1 MAG: YbaN family protein [Nitrospiraceae bacterium]
MIHKPILITLGLLCVGLAVLGIFLPVLPTTPLLLLALACFAKSSEKLHTWLLTNKTFGPLIKTWHETRSMPRKAKIYAIISIVIVGGISFYSVHTSTLKLILVAALIIPVIIILTIKTTESL